ncbi:MAG: chaperone modulator CbpM, partial [Gammaproteobacteria bacterium]|nr:chaperone modulator CbpM [Gammaproteobacteria bacterium]
MKEIALTGVVLDERTEFSLTDLSQACSTTTEWVIELVQEGVLEPAGRQPTQWRFSGTSLKRAHTAMR